jgi:hypothetical protein
MYTATYRRRRCGLTGNRGQEPYLMLLGFILIFWPLLLASPFVFLIKEVRKTIALRVAALTVVGGSYFLLLLAAPAVIGAWIMSVADNPAPVTNVIDRDQVIAGIRFPKGSTVERGRFNGKIQNVVPSEDIEINGIPARRDRNVWFRPDGTVESLTTSRTWMYRGIPVPVESMVFMNTSGCVPATPSMATSAAPCGIYQINIWRTPFDATLNVEDMLAIGTASLYFKGDTLTMLSGHYVWRGDHYSSYSVGVDGQITRVSLDRKMITRVGVDGKITRQPK